MIGLWQVPAANAAVGSEAQAGWPQQRYDAAQTGYNPIENQLNRQNAGDLQLTAAYHLGTTFTADPPVVSNGVMYVTGYGLQTQEFLYAFNAQCAVQQNNCSPLWTADVGFNSQPRLATADGYVFVASNSNSTILSPPNGRLWAFKTDCAGSQGDGNKPPVCQPAWVADFPGSNPLDKAPTVSNGMVFVSDGFVELPNVASIYAFDENCGTGGASCQPVWQAPISVAGTGSVAVSDGVAYIGDYGEVSAYGIHCATGGAVCAPSWRGPFGIVAGGVSVADGEVFATGGGFIYAFPAMCGQPVCAPIWYGGEASDGASQAAVANGIVYFESDSGDLFAFPTLCSGLCQPLWTAVLRTGHVYVGESTPAIADGVVYVTWSQSTFHSAQRWLEAYPTSCSATCHQLFKGTAGFWELTGPAIANGNLYLAGGPFSGPGVVFVWSPGQGN
jgi:outer membrane protein assembly factor BamB